MVTPLVGVAELPHYSCLAHLVFRMSMIVFGPLLGNAALRLGCMARSIPTARWHCAKLLWRA